MSCGHVVKSRTTRALIIDQLARPNYSLQVRVCDISIDSDKYHTNEILWNSTDSITEILSGEKRVKKMLIVYPYYQVTLARRKEILHLTSEQKKKCVYGYVAGYLKLSVDCIRMAVGYEIICLCL